MNTRRKARETALQILYRMDINEGVADASDFEELTAGTEARRYCESIVRGVSERKAEIDGVIEANSENWTMERMPVVDRNILRIAVYELFTKDVPYKVVIDEAVELAKRYGTEESGPFVNGVIDKVWKDSAGSTR